MDNAMAKSPTTYVIRPNAYPGHWDVSYARADGHCGYVGCSDALGEAVKLARMFVGAEDKVFVRKSLYRGRNAGAWHKISTLK